MKKFLIILMLGIVCQSSCQIEKNPPASQHLIPSYDITKDDSTIDSCVVLTTKKFLLLRMDKLEVMLGEKFQTIPYIRFGLPNRTPFSNWYLYLAMYEPSEETIYFKSKEYMTALESGTLHTSNWPNVDEKEFERVAVHELVHWYHDLLVRRLTGQWLSPRDTSKNALIEYTVIVEGVAEYIEGLYHRNKDDNYIPTDYFPDALLEDAQKYPDEQLFWRKYGVSFVGPILDKSLIEGLIYLTLHQFKIEDNFHTSAGEYQKQAIKALSQ